jgi:hypothetical protein
MSYKRWGGEIDGAVVVWRMVKWWCGEGCIPTGMRGPACIVLGQPKTLLAAAARREAGAPRRRGRPRPRPSEKDAKFAQKLGQLQPFIAVLPPECVGQLASFGPA